MLLNILLHRVPWNGDRIRLYKHDGTFVTEGWCTIEGWQDSAVRLRQGGRDQHVIRRDLFKWAPRSEAWTYHYGE